MRRLFACVLLASIWAPAVRAQNVVTTLAGRGGDGGCPSFDIPPGGSTFFVDPVKTPVGVAVDPNGKLFVSMGSNCVFRLDADGLLRLGFPDSGPFRIGTGTPGLADGDATLALVSNPQHIALDSAGNLYIADASNHRIRKVNKATWTISTVAGGGSLRPFDGILATDASFLFPTSVAVDAAGNLYVVDSNAAKVFKVDTSGILTRFAGSGGFTYNGEGIPATSAGMIPMDVAVDHAGNVFIADWSNSIVRKVDTAGIMTTAAGNPFNVTGLGDGGPAAFGGILSKPRGVDVDVDGNLYIADTEHHRIRKVDTTGLITTVAGDGTPGFSDTQLNFPYDVAADNLGNIFIADTVNNRLTGVIVTQRTYRLTLNTSGTGSGTLSGAGSYIVGQFVPVSATASSGSTFVSWSGPNAAECASGTVLMDADKSCTATFDAAPDTTAPVLTGVPASFTVTANLLNGAVVTYTLPTASDPDDAAGPVICTPPSGSTFPLGDTTVTCTSTDTHGNAGSASFTVTVVAVSVVVPVFVTETITVTDTVTPALAVLVNVSEAIFVTDTPTPVVLDITAPVIAGLPGSLTAEATGPGGAIVKFPQPTASDPDDAAGPVTCAPASGSVFAIGTTTVTCQSVDTHGNLGTATFTLTVVDTTPPTLTLPSTIKANPTGPAGAVVTFAASASDLVSGAVAVTCAPAAGSTFAVGTTTVACSASDGHANIETGSFTVVVLTPAQVVANLIADATADGFRQALNLLQNLLAALNRNNPAAACGQLNAFIDQVRAQTGKRLSVDEASGLIRDATDIAATLGCPAR